MFTLKKILTAFILPPGIFIITLIFIGVWFLFKKNWKIGVFNCLIGFLMWVLSISPVSDIMIRGLESEYKMPLCPDGDVIVLLGEGVYEKAPDLSGVGAPSAIYLSRIVTAVRLQKEQNVPIILSGQRALIAKRFIINLGIPANEIMIENKSRDTFENAKFTRDICIRSDYKKPILVTSAYHLKRSILSFKKVGLEVIPFPADFKSWKDKQYGWTAYLPGDFAKASIALKEYAGLIFYRFAY